MNESAHRVYIAFGSNIGDREQYLQQALVRMQRHDAVQIDEVSPIYETEPIGYTEQGAFLNIVASARTMLLPYDLLDVAQSVEQKLERQRAIHWGPRTIDIDILVYDDEQCNEDSLQIPHPRMTERGFVMIPLADIAGDLIIPGQGKTVAELAQKRSDEGVRIWPTHFKIVGNEFVLTAN